MRSETPGPHTLRTAKAPRRRGPLAVLPTAVGVRKRWTPGPQALRSAKAPRQRGSATVLPAAVGPDKRWTPGS